MQYKLDFLGQWACAAKHENILTCFFINSWPKQDPKAMYYPMILLQPTTIMSGCSGIVATSRFSFEFLPSHSKVFSHDFPGAF